MKTKIKLVVGSFVVAGLTLATAAMPVLAHGVIRSENRVTGAQSFNESILTLRSRFMQVVRQANIYTNSASVDGNTGFNAADHNTMNAHVSTGGMSVNGSFHNSSGPVTPAVINLGDVLDVRAENDTTGFRSLNINDVDMSSVLDVVIDRSTNARNSLEVDANTGGNSTTGNTGSAMQHTGSIGGNLTVSNDSWAGSPAAIVLGGDRVSVDTGNEQTGAESLNENDVNLRQTVDVSVRESNYVANHVDVDGNTGFNAADHNTGDASLTTGNMTENVSISNSSPQSAPVIVGGGGSLDVKAENEKTGFSSTNLNTINATSDVNVNVSESTTTSNSVHFNLNSGGNSASGNTGDADVHTGSGHLNVNISNR